MCYIGAMSTNTACFILASVAFASLAACSDADSTVVVSDGDTEYPPLAGGELLEGAPNAADLPPAGKADAVYPRQFDLLSTQTPVKNQGSRGTCSFFSTVALAEHIHMTSTGEALDLSEQYAVYAVKVEANRSSEGEGSNVQTNLEVFQQLGLVEESIWPYEPSVWGPNDDPACVGSSRPVRCHTHGDPPADVQGARRWYVGKPQYVSSHPKSIKHFLSTTKQALLLSLPVHCQAWNYASQCALGTSTELWGKGMISYPTAADAEHYRLAGGDSHAVLLVGWDDDVTFPVRDERGKQVKGEDGKPLMERGAFLIKNSWGTNSFGKRNPYGSGYGLVSQRYVQEFGSIVRVSDGVDEVCGDELDNDGDGAADCRDADCGEESACRTALLTYTVDGPIAIPDGASDGVVTHALVAAGREIAGLTVEVDIRHPRPSDLVLMLEPENREPIYLMFNDASDGPDLQAKFQVSTLLTESTDGVWQLRVIDTRAGEKGTVDRWSLSITPCENGWDCENSRESYGNYYTNGPIPDGDASGLESEIDVMIAGVARNVSVAVAVSHPASGQLSLLVEAPDGRMAVLKEARGETGAYRPHEYTTTDLEGASMLGNWKLWVFDEVEGITGELGGWDLYMDGSAGE